MKLTDNLYSKYRIITENLSLSQEIKSFEDKWVSIMSHVNLVNQLKQTYSLNGTIKTSYGFKSSILIVDGLNYEMLEKSVSYIEDSYVCMVIFNKQKRSNMITAQFIFKTPGNVIFSPVKVKPWELYLGNGFDGEPIVISMLEYPHLLLTGGTRSGKSKMLDCALSSLISSCNEYELELYLIQVAKSDLVLYEDCIQTRAFADDLDKAIIVLEHIQKKMMDRDNLIRPIRKKALGDNYQDYNKTNPSGALSTCYVVFDEMASLFDTKGDSVDIKKKKQKVVSLSDAIAQYGAGLGVFLISCLQRPTADKISPFIKSQSTLKVSFRQNNSKSSEVAIDDNEKALGLNQREAVYYTGQEYKYLIVPLTFSKNVYKFIQVKLKPGHRNLFTDLKKIDAADKGKVKEVPKIQSTPLTFEKVSKTSEKILKDNIAKIPGFVPYNKGKVKE